MADFMGSGRFQSVKTSSRPLRRANTIGRVARHGKVIGGNTLVGGYAGIKVADEEVETDALTEVPDLYASPLPTLADGVGIVELWKNYTPVTEDDGTETNTQRNVRTLVVLDTRCMLDHAVSADSRGEWLQLSNALYQVGEVPAVPEDPGPPIVPATPAIPIMARGVAIQALT